MNFNADSVLKLFELMGIKIPDNKKDDFKTQFDLLFGGGEDDPESGSDTVTFSSSFKNASGDDKMLELDELKYQAEKLANKYTSQAEKDALSPVVNLFMGSDNKIDEELFKKVAGEDGKISEQELMALDTDGDGKISQAEVEAFKNKAAEKPIESSVDDIIALAKEYGGKSLSKDEVTELLADNGNKSDARAILAKIFAGADGKLNEAVFDKISNGNSTITPEQLKALDKNGDGKITSDEIEAFKNGTTTAPPTNGPGGTDNTDGTDGTEKPDGTEGADGTEKPGGTEKPDGIDKPEAPTKTPAELLAEAVNNARNDAAVKNLVAQAENATKAYNGLSDTYKNDSTVKAAMNNITTFNNLYAKLASAKTPEEVTTILNQIKGMAATIANAEKVIAQAVSDEKRAVYADEDNTDINSILTRNSSLNSDYQNDVCRTIGGKHRVDNDSYQTASSSAVSEFNKLARADLNSYAVVLRKELKEQMGDAYNKDEVDKFIDAAIEKTLKDFTSGQLVGVGHRKEGEGARGYNKLIFNDYGKGRDWNGKYEYSVKSLINTFMTNFKAQVNDTPTKQIADTKKNAENKYTENTAKNTQYQALRHGGILLDENGGMITDRNGRPVSINDYLDDKGKKEVDETLQEMEQKQQEIDKLMAKMRNATTADEAKGYEKELSGLYSDMDKLRSTVREYVNRAWSSYQYQNQNNNGYGGGYGYNQYEQKYPAILKI